MNKTDFMIIGNIVIATIFGLYAQSISYFIHGQVPSVSPVYPLALLTAISVSLYIITPMLTFMSIQRLKMNKNRFIPYLVIDGVFGLPVTIYSLFVLAMWM